MKWLSSQISGQNLFLKMAIFITGLVIGLDSSLRQLISQSILFLLYLFLQPRLYLSLFSALKRIISFLAAYWVFATVFKQSFPDSVLFSVQLIYLLMVSVVVFAEVPPKTWAYDSRFIRKLSWINALFYYCFATALFVKSFFRQYQAASGVESLKPKLETVFSAVHNDSGIIGHKVRGILATDSREFGNEASADITGIVFLTLLVLVHGL